MRTKKLKPYYKKNGIILYCGDCLWVMKTFEDKSFDMVLTDLPYGITACKWDSVIDLIKMWKLFKQITTEICTFVFTTSQPFTTTLIMSNLKMFRYEWIWEKNRGTGFNTANKRVLKCHESVLVFFQRQSIYNPQMIKRSKEEYRKYLRVGKRNPVKLSESYGGGKRPALLRTAEEQRFKFPRSIIKFKIADTRDGSGHPTQKPVALFEYLIKTYTNEGDVVLDNCAGSGTTGIACRNLGRRCVMIEKEEKYCQIIVKRLEGNL